MPEIIRSIEVATAGLSPPLHYLHSIPCSSPSPLQTIYNPLSIAGTFVEISCECSLSHASQEQGWMLPTPIQAEAVPLILGLGDVMGAAETGSGKTGAFGIPILQVREQMTPPAIPGFISLLRPSNPSLSDVFMPVMSALLTTNLSCARPCCS